MCANEAQASFTLYFNALSGELKDDKIVTAKSLTICVFLILTQCMLQSNFLFLVPLEECCLFQLKAISHISDCARTSPSTQLYVKVHRHTLPHPHHERTSLLIKDPTGQNSGIQKETWQMETTKEPPNTRYSRTF